MNKTSLNRRLKKLESRVATPTFACVRGDEVERRARTTMRPSDLETLDQVLSCRPESCTSAQRAVWNRWKKARGQALLEVTGGAAVVVVLRGADCTLGFAYADKDGQLLTKRGDAAEQRLGGEKKKVYVHLNP